ncbi:MAG: response regulator [Brevinematia bacterium]
MKVLIVEDNPLNLRLFADTLNMKGFEVITARNGMEALEILKNVTPDIILLDLYMPGMSGFRFASEISKDPRYQGIPIIVVSASSSVYDVKEMASYNIKAYLVKPVSPTKLLETLKKVIIQEEIRGTTQNHHLQEKSSLQKDEETVALLRNESPERVNKRELETGIRISVDDLIEGMILGEPVVKNRTIIYKEGTTIDSKITEKLKSLGIREVYITKESFEEFRDLIDIKREKEETNVDIFKDFDE